MGFLRKVVSALGHVEIQNVHSLEPGGVESVDVGNRLREAIQKWRRTEKWTGGAELAVCGLFFVHVCAGNLCEKIIIL